MTPDEQAQIEASDKEYGEELDRFAAKFRQHLATFERLGETLKK